jgi:hypothetical protein
MDVDVDGDGFGWFLESFGYFMDESCLDGSE